MVLQKQVLDMKLSGIKMHLLDLRLNQDNRSKDYVDVIA